MQDRYLVLEDGSFYKGLAFGANINALGEVVFSTGMTGYPQSLTDSSYQGQILVFTYPLIGNYGIPQKKQNNKFDSFESGGIKVRGLIVSSYVDKYSHWQSYQSLDQWLKSENIPGIFGVDTRDLTIKLRSQGTMLGQLSNTKNNQDKLTDPNKENLVDQVSTKKIRIIGRGKYKILLIDCGVKEGIIDGLLRRDATIYQIPWDLDPLEKRLDFNGIVISNGPGDPKRVVKTIDIVRKLMQKRTPILGICLGNQIMALASGANTYKLKFGHRSHNQPVKLINSDKCYLTTQNHGFAVDNKTIDKDWQAWFTNLNDNTNEGLRHNKFPFLSVQFHPEGRPGPFDTDWVFDEFLRHVTHNM